MPDEILNVSEVDLDDVMRSPTQDNPDIPRHLIELATTLPEETPADDSICVAIRDDDDPDTVLKEVMLGLAEEQSSLRTLRQRRVKENKDTSHISVKRGMLLKYMSETLLQRQALHGPSGDLDLKSPKFREVFKMFLETISSTFDEVKIPVEFKEMFFHALSKNLEGWEAKADRLIKAMSIKA